MKTLISGCGGGYDIFGGLPIYFKGDTNNTFLLNLSTGTRKKTLEDHGCKNLYNGLLWEVAPHNIIHEIEYFPEGYLANQLQRNVYALLLFEIYEIEGGLQDLLDAYNYLLDYLENINTLYLVDGGCDAIFPTGVHGKQTLGTPVEDFIHLWLVNRLIIPNKYLCCIGADIDKAHDVPLDILELRLKELETDTIKAEILDQNDVAVQRYIEVFEQSQPFRSIVHSLIVACIKGMRGYSCPEHIKGRLGGESVVELNDRVRTLFTFRFDRIADDNIHLDKMHGHMNIDHVDQLIEKLFR
jgi:hypothetical protein